jgi:hypothetical protein
MYGRYGSDQLNLFLLFAGLLLSLIGMFSRQRLLTLAADLCWLFAIFRLLSRNMERRRTENQKFLKITDPCVSWYRQKRNQARDRDHCYFKCPCCGAQLRVPRGKGKISITCRQCSTVFQEKT